MQQIVFSANSAMMGCRQTRKACCLVLGRAGRAGLSLVQSLAPCYWTEGSEPSHSRGSRDPVATLRTLPPSLAGTSHS